MSHAQISELLPWYVNGTLEAAEQRLVEDHLAACPDCVQELARSKALAAALRERQQSAPSPHPIQLARLMERIEASERGRGMEDLPEEGSEDGSEQAARGTTRQPDRRGRRGRHAFDVHPRPSLLGSTPRPVRWALAGQLAALLLLASALAVGPLRRAQPGGAPPATIGAAATTGAAAAPATPSETAAAPADPANPAAPAAPEVKGSLFVTLSAPAAPAATAAARPQIRLVFVESATEKQMRDVLLRTRGRLVDGPSPLGAYTLELPAQAPAATAAPQVPASTGTPQGAGRTAGAGQAAPVQPAPRASLTDAAPDSIGTVLAYLRAQAIVRFAEPVAGTPAPAPQRP